jgi:hypothetical protein
MFNNNIIVIKGNYIFDKQQTTHGNITILILLFLLLLLLANIVVRNE